MSSRLARLAAAGLTLGLLAPVSMAHAQYLDPRAGQAIAICASAMGAAIPECAKLNGALGVTPGAPGAANQASAAASLLGALGAARGSSNAAGAAGIAGALLGAAAQARAAAPTVQAAPNAPGMAEYAAAQQYQACVAANPANWQSCVAQMQNGAGAQQLNQIAANQQLGMAALQQAGGPEKYAACVRQFGNPNAQNAVAIQQCFLGAAAIPPVPGQPGYAAGVPAPPAAYGGNPVAARPAAPLDPLAGLLGGR